MAHPVRVSKPEAPASGRAPASVVAAAAPLVTRRTAYLLLGLLVLVWGVHWPVVKIALRDVPPLTYATLRVGTALLSVVALLAATGRLARPPREDRPVLLVVGLGQVAAAVVLMNLALLVVPAGRSSILSYTSPFWAAIAQGVLLGAVVGRREAIGIAVGIAGIGILLNPAAIDWGQGALLGSSLLVVSAMIHGVAVVIVNSHRWRTTPLLLQPWQLLIAVVPLGVAALLLEGGRGVVIGPVVVLATLYSGPLATGFAYWASQTVARALPPTVTSMGMLATPVIGLSASAVLIGEPIAALDLLGFAVTGIGIAIVTVIGSRGDAGGRAAGSATLAAK